jgi:hypothetical protein
MVTPLTVSWSCILSVTIRPPTVDGLLVVANAPQFLVPSWLCALVLGPRGPRRTFPVLPPAPSASEAPGGAYGGGADVPESRPAKATAPSRNHRKKVHERGISLDADCIELAVAVESVTIRPVLRRGVSFLALLAVIAAPAVTSTRLFCRYTGQEIVGCAEARVPQGAHVRADDCCDQMTLRALEGMRQADDRLQPGPTTVAIGASSVFPAAALAPASPAAQHAPWSSTGPPAFLAHRALLI